MQDKDLWFTFLLWLGSAVCLVKGEYPLTMLFGAAAVVVAVVTEYRKKW